MGEPKVETNRQIHPCREATDNAAHQMSRYLSSCLMTPMLAGCLTGNRGSTVNQLLPGLIEQEVVFMKHKPSEFMAPVN
jgi:hypothetical protein